MEDKEINKNLKALLLAVELEESKEIEREYLSTTHLKHQRAKNAAFNLVLFTEDERTHYFSCKFCKGLVKGFQKHIHPTFLQLVQYSLQILDEETKVAINLHLQEAECADCNNVLSKFSLPAVVKRAIEKFGVAFGEATTPALVASHSPLIDYSDIDYSSVAQEQIIPEKFRIFHRTEKFILIVTEDADQLMVYVTTKEKDLKKMHLELIGENTWVKDLELNPEGDNYVYREYFPDLDKIIAFLGTNKKVYLIATPVVD